MCPQGAEGGAGLVRELTKGQQTVYCFSCISPAAGGAAVLHSVMPAAGTHSSSLMLLLLLLSVLLLFAQITMLLMEIETGLSSCPSLKRILSAGEALTASLARHVSSVLPHVDLVNAYGPTEATVYITHHTFDPQDSNARPTVSIGKPLSNSKCYVVDRKNVSDTLCTAVTVFATMFAWF